MAAVALPNFPAAVLYGRCRGQDTRVVTGEASDVISHPLPAQVAAAGGEPMPKGGNEGIAAGTRTPRRSVSAAVNYGIRFTTRAEAEAFLGKLARVWPRPQARDVKQHGVACML